MNYWFKILESEETRFIKHAYQLLLYDIANNPNCVNCVSKVNFLLSSLGFYDVWVNQGVGNKRAFLNVCKQRLSDIFMQDWNSRIVESSLGPSNTNNVYWVQGLVGPIFILFI